MMAKLTQAHVFPAPQCLPSASEFLQDFPKPAFFLDIDGTLLEIAQRPDLVEPSPDLLPLLCRLHKGLDGALALVTGRKVFDVLSIFQTDILPFPVAGCHGDEILLPNPGSAPYQLSGFSLDQAQAAFDKIIKNLPQDKGLLIENKRKTLAIHYRNSDITAAELQNLLESKLESPFHIMPGHKVFEIKPKNLHKGLAVNHLLTCAEFQTRYPVFFGDDITDEYGFAAAQAQKGAGVLINPCRPSRADWSLPNVSALHRWLQGCVATMLSS